MYNTTQFILEKNRGYSAKQVKKYIIEAHSSGLHNANLNVVIQDVEKKEKRK